jgi:hypothetical protein
MNNVPEKSNCEEGQYGAKHMAAGLAKTALIASCGAAIPTPPIDLEIGPIPMRLVPFVAKTGVDNIATKDTIIAILKMFFMTYSSLGLVQSLVTTNLSTVAFFHPLSAIAVCDLVLSLALLLLNKGVCDH